MKHEQSAYFIFWGNSWPIQNNSIQNFNLLITTKNQCILKGLSHQIFWFLFWHVQYGKVRTGIGTSTGYLIFLLLLWFCKAIFSLWVYEAFHTITLGDPRNLRDGFINLKSLWLVHSVLGELQKNGKIRQICKRVSNNNKKLASCRFISGRNLHLARGSRRRK